LTSDGEGHADEPNENARRFFFAADNECRNARGGQVSFPDHSRRPLFATFAPVRFQISTFVDFAADVNGISEIGEKTPSN